MKNKEDKNFKEFSKILAKVGEDIKPRAAFKKELKSRLLAKLEGQESAKTIWKPTRFLQLAGVATIIALVAIFSFNLLPAKKNQLSKNDLFIQKALAAVSEPNKVLYIKRSWSNGGVKGSAEGWVDIDNNIEIFKNSDTNIYYDGNKHLEILESSENKGIYSFTYLNPGTPYKQGILRYKDLLNNPDLENLGETTYKGIKVYKLKQKPDDSYLIRFETVFYVDVKTKLPVYELTGGPTGLVETKYEVKLLDRDSVDPSDLKIPEIEGKNIISTSYENFDLAKKDLNSRKQDTYYLGEQLNLSNNNLIELRNIEISSDNIIFTYDNQFKQSSGNKETHQEPPLNYRYVQVAISQGPLSNQKFRQVWDTIVSDYKESPNWGYFLSKKKVGGYEAYFVTKDIPLLDKPIKERMGAAFLVINGNLITIGANLSSEGWASKNYHLGVLIKEEDLLLMAKTLKNFNSKFGS